MNKNEEIIEPEPEQELELSFCKNLITDDMSSEEKHKIFDKHKIKFEHFDKNPYNTLFNDNLSFRIKEEIVESRIAIPQIISLLAFNKEISQNGLGTILETEFLPLNNSTRSLSKIPPSKNKK